MSRARPASRVPDPLRAGVHAAKQARSQHKHQALLLAGRRLLAAHDLGTLTVAQITREAGMAVGSFYSRFADKDAWFGELVQVTADEVLSEVQALHDSARWAGAPAQRKVALLVQHLVEVHRRHRGLMRAALGERAQAARFGAPLQTYGQRIADAVHAALLEHMHRVPRSSRRHRVGVALQLIYGALVNAVLRDPGPLMLDDPRLPRELTAVFLGVVRLDD